MEKSYWLSRKRSSVANAASAGSAEARLIHLDLAGRYSVKAALAGAEVVAASVAPIVALTLPEDDSPYYERLEIGARWLAARTGGDERDAHLGMADRYARLGRTATRGGR